MKRYYYEIIESDDTQYPSGNIAIKPDKPDEHQDYGVEPGDTFEAYHDDTDAAMTYRYLGEVEFDDVRDYRKSDTSEIIDKLEDDLYE